MDTTKPPSKELLNAISYLTSLQKKEGYVVGEVAFSTMITSQYIIMADITQQEIPQSRKDKFLHYFQTWQTNEGGWG